MDLFSHSNFVRFFLRRCVLVLYLGAPSDFFLVRGWGCGAGAANRGATVAIYLQVQRLHARWTKTSWAHTARSLALAFY